jgi:hypothetical protein
MLLVHGFRETAPEGFHNTVFPQRIPWPFLLDLNGVNIPFAARRRPSLGFPKIYKVYYSNPYSLRNSDGDISVALKRV